MFANSLCYITGRCRFGGALSRGPIRNHHKLNLVSAVNHHSKSCQINQVCIYLHIYKQIYNNNFKTLLLGNNSENNCVFWGLCGTNQPENQIKMEHVSFTSAQTWGCKTNKRIKDDVTVVKVCQNFSVFYTESSKHPPQSFWPQSQIKARGWKEEQTGGESLMGMKKKHLYTLSATGAKGQAAYVIHQTTTK